MAVAGAGPPVVPYRFDKVCCPFVLSPTTSHLTTPPCLLCESTVTGVHCWRRQQGWLLQQQHVAVGCLSCVQQNGESVVCCCCSRRVFKRESCKLFGSGGPTPATEEGALTWQCLCSLQIVVVVVRHWSVGTSAHAAGLHTTAGVCCLMKLWQLSAASVGDNNS